MIRIEPNALYSRSDLIEMLEPVGIDPDTFIARLRPRKVFRAVWYGRDLLAALDQAPALGDQEPATMPAAKNRGGGQKGRGSGRPGAEIEAYMKELKG
jgi:hypothetical protein